MPKTKELSKEVRAQIEILFQEGYSQRKIKEKINSQQKIKGKHNISLHGVQYTLKRLSETGTNMDRKRSGRPKITTSADDRQLIISSKRDRKKTAPELTAEFNSTQEHPVSVSTVKSRLSSAGLRGCVAVKKPLLRKVNKQKRLAWAKRYKNWTVEDWKKVLWTDESKFELFGNKRRVFVRRKPEEKMIPDCVVPTVKHGGGSVMVWGCFGGERTGDLIEVKGIMKKEQYHSILERHAIPSGLRLLGKNFIFQQDNDPKHSSKLCKNYLESKQKNKTLEIMSWPPQSPDLSPIELAWDELDRKVRESFPLPKNKRELFQSLTNAWEGLPSTFFEKLLKRMPRICKAVIKARGGFIDEDKI